MRLALILVLLGTTGMVAAQEKPATAPAKKTTATVRAGRRPPAKMLLDEQMITPAGEVISMREKPAPLPAEPQPPAETKGKPASTMAADLEGSTTRKALPHKPVPLPKEPKAGNEKE
jgi:hypothetical protein